MKAIATIILGLLLTGCAGMDMSGSSGSGGSSGSSANEMGRASPASSADFRRGFDPNDPYHGG